MVEAEGTDIAQWIGDVHADIAVAPQGWDQVRQRGFPPVNFAIHQRRRSGRRVRHDDPFNTINIDALATGQP